MEVAKRSHRQRADGPVEVRGEPASPTERPGRQARRHRRPRRRRGLWGAVQAVALLCTAAAVVAAWLTPATGPGATVVVIVALAVAAAAQGQRARAADRSQTWQDGQK